MKIITTDIGQDLTRFLLEEVKKNLSDGKKVFYITPSSLSFEKEKKILSLLSAGKDTAGFDFVVTRFNRLPFYFENTKISEKLNLSSAGKAMLFYSVLTDLGKNELPNFYALRESIGFIDKLSGLRDELETGNLSVEDLPNTEKLQEIAKILQNFDDLYVENFNVAEPLSDFIELLQQGKFTASLQQVSFIVEGFTRFSAQEEKLVHALAKEVPDLTLGLYVDEKSTSEIGVYQDSARLLTHFPEAQIVKKTGQKIEQVYSKLTALWQAENDFVMRDSLTSFDAEGKLEIWQAENSQAECDELAQNVQEILAKGYHLKDVTVLLGDSKAYEIPIKQTFLRYNLPYFYAKEEEMRDHPLVVLLESLLAIKDKNYQSEDVLTLLKTQLYRQVDSTVNLEVSDYLEIFIKLYKVKFQRGFSKSFVDERYVGARDYFSRLDEIESLRENLLGKKSPLQKFLSQRKQKAENLLSAFMKFLAEGQILSSLEDLYKSANAANDFVEASRHEQVFQLLNQNLTEFHTIFKGKELTVLEFLSLLLAGFKQSHYRRVPANVDVVKVRDYELVEPRTNKFVFVLGLTQTNFPKIKHNTSLLTDKERQEINEKFFNEGKFLEPLETSNHSKNLFTTLSLLNSATEKLILSVPQIFSNEESDGATLFELLEAHVFPSVKRFITSQKTIDSSHLLAAKGLSEKDISTAKLDKRLTDLIYNSEHFSASVSSIESFENCEYQYFLSRNLHLKPFEEIDLQSNVVGSYFHEVLESALSGQVTAENFDDKLTVALQQVDSKYHYLFEQNASSRLTHSYLSDILFQSGALIKQGLQEKDLSILSQELAFQRFKIDDLQVRGRIDRVDMLQSKAIGAVDYKSSGHDFDIKSAYDGTSLQLLTYLNVLQQQYPDKSSWGALYLHLQNPKIKLTDLSSVNEISSILTEKMHYTGILNKENKEFFVQKDFVHATNNTKNFYTSDQLSALMAHNREIFIKAKEKLSSGLININPVKKHRVGKVEVQGCTYCPFKSICRFESDRHAGQARLIGEKDKKEILETLEKEVIL